ARGAAAPRRLTAGADVFLENFSPGTAGRLGFGYEEVRRIRPDIIYFHASGYGQDGPYRDMKAFDGLIQAETGGDGDDGHARVARQGGAVHLRRRDGAVRRPERDDGPAPARPHGRGPGGGRFHVRLYDEHARILSLPALLRGLRPPARWHGAPPARPLWRLPSQGRQAHRRGLRQR